LVSHKGNFQAQGNKKNHNPLGVALANKKLPMHAILCTAVKISGMKKNIQTAIANEIYPFL